MSCGLLCTHTLGSVSPGFCFPDLGGCWSSLHSLSWWSLDANPHPHPSTAFTALGPSCFQLTRQAAAEPRVDVLQTWSSGVFQQSSQEKEVEDCS